MQKLLKGMLCDDIIQPSKNPWGSPIVLVRKKDGSIRMCVDYRKLNGVTRKDAYPLPPIDDTLDTLSGSKWFSTLDLISGYWQVEVNEKDREKMAFCSHEGLFEFNVMPFGLCNAPATFQRVMNLVLAGLQWSSCLVYLDDIIILGRNFEEHLKQIRAVLERLRMAGLKLKPAKCNFFKQEVQYLGHIVSANGISTDPTKITNWPKHLPPRRKFNNFWVLLGTTEDSLKTLLQLLGKLAERSTSFNWTSECEQSFSQLKEKLTSSSVLAFLNFKQTFLLDTDASNTGIGAVLSQEQEDGSEKVIAYASPFPIKVNII